MRRVKIWARIDLGGLDTAANLGYYYLPSGFPRAIFLGVEVRDLR